MCRKSSVSLLPLRGKTCVSPLIEAAERELNSWWLPAEGSWQVLVECLLGLVPTGPKAL